MPRHAAAALTHLVAAARLQVARVFAPPLELLLAGGADRAATNKEGKTPLDVAKLRNLKDERGQQAIQAHRDMRAAEAAACRGPLWLSPAARSCSCTARPAGASSDRGS